MAKEKAPRKKPEKDNNPPPQPPKNVTTEVSEEDQLELMESFSKPIQTVPEYKTTVTTTVISEEDQQDLMKTCVKPTWELDDALAKQHEAEQDTMKALINDNVRMEQEVKKAEDRVQEMHTKVELLKLDVDAEKVKTREKEDRIKEMENEMVMLIVSKKSGKKDKENKAKAKSLEDAENKADEITNKYQNNETEKDNEPKLPYNEVYEKRIKNLNFRLKRLAADDEEKSKRIINLESRLEVTDEYANELEKYVDSATREDIKRRLAEKEKKRYVTYYDPANIVSYETNPPPRSATCVVQ